MTGFPQLLSGALRRSRLAFDWNANDVSLKARGGQALTLTRATVNGIATASDASGAIRKTGHSEPRWTWQFDATTGQFVPGLVLERLRKNLVLQTESHATAPWAAVGTPTNTPAALVAGSLALDLLGDDDAATLEGYTQPVAFTGNAVKGLAVFAAPSTSASTVIRVRDTTASVTVLLGVLTWVNGAPVVTMTIGKYFGARKHATINGVTIYRLSLQVAAATAANANQIEVYPASDAALAASATGACYVGGWHVEDQPVAGSYIPNTVAAQTCVADACTGAFLMRPQAMTGLWSETVQLPSSQCSAERIWEVGDGAGAGLSLQRMAGGYQFVHNNGTTVVKSAIALAANVGDGLQLWPILNADGSVQLLGSVNGGAQVIGAMSAANPLPASWHLQTHTFNGDGAGGNVGLMVARLFQINPPNVAGIAISAAGIGVPGTQGFGVGVCPGAILPAGMMSLAGTYTTGSDNYGNYQYTDGSVMVWIPAFYYKWGTGLNGFALNVVDIKDFSYFADVATANAAGYALHRAFYDGGVVKSGVFVDKYQCSNNGGIASSIKNGAPLTSAATHNPFAGLTGAPANAYYGAIAAAKTRGADFFCSSRFIRAALALLSLAHAQAATSAAACAWYDATGVKNFPKGNNNNALSDTNDTSVLYASDGFPNCGLTGSGAPFAKTTHNGQACGVADLNGNVWEVTPGLATEDAGTQYYVLKTAVAMKNMTGGDGGALDLWGTDAQMTPNYDVLGATYEAALASSTVKLYGAAAAQVLSDAVSGLAWQWAGLGAPLVAGVGGANRFGNDGFWDYRPARMCPLSGGSWSPGSPAGVWAFDLSSARTGSYNGVGFRAALYP